MNIILIHGAYGDPNENWFPWLKKSLEKLGHDVFIPRFPTPENQNLETWLKVFKEYEKYLTKDCILIGHSLGATVILHILEQLEIPIKASFFIASVVDELGIKEFDRLNKTFLEKDFDWAKIKKNCKQFYVLYSDNDPYIKQEAGRKIAIKLGIEPVLVKGAGHFNEESGYNEFPLLLEKIKLV